jgi:acetoin utilization protein AcuB
MKIQEIMRPGPLTIAAIDCLGTAYTTMTRSRVRHLPVMSDGKLVGMLSERDVLAARARVDDGNWWPICVRDAMHSPAQTAGPDDSVTEVAGRMAVAKLGAMPIVDRGKLLGIVAVGDVLDAEVRSTMSPSPSPVNEATAADAMTPWPFTISPDALLVDAVAIMVDRHLRHLPVVDGASAIVGMLSERDVRTAIGDLVQYLAPGSRSPATYRVQDVMTRPAVAVPFDRPLVELARQFADGQIGAVPVVDKFGALLGIVSYVDALRVLSA